MRVFFSAGEASGDRYAWELGRRLPKEILIEGVGGRRLQEIAQSEVISSANWGAVGIFESLRVVPRVLKGYWRAKRALMAGTPGVFVPIDYGFMNIKLARFAKSLGWKVLYFIPPGSWRKTQQGSDLPSVTDEIVTPFAWSAEILNGMGASAHWFGHPLKQMVQEAGKAGASRSGIAVLPGSREHEIWANLPVIAQALDQAQVPGPIRFAVAGNLADGELEEIWSLVLQSKGAKFTGHVEFNRDTYEVLKASRAAVVCSGTATLEAALCECPTVVMYRGSWMMELEFKIRKPQFDYISLPNILLGKTLLPELLQQDASAESVGGWLSRLANDGEDRSAQLEGFQQLSAEMGGSDALDRTVDLILQIQSR